MRKVLLSALTVFVSVAAWAQTQVSIYDVQYVSQTDLGNCIDESPYNNGDTVVLTGIIMVDGEEYGGSSQDAYMQSSNMPWEGIEIYGGSTTYNIDMRADLFAGDSITVVGIITEYQGQTEIEPLPSPYNAFTIHGSGYSINDTTVSVGDLNDESKLNQLTTGEQWENLFVKIEDLTVVLVDFFSGGSRVSFDVADADGNVINVSDRFKVQKLPSQGGNFVAPSVGDQFSYIKGIVRHSKNNCPGASGRGYEINPFHPSHYQYGPSAPRISNVNRNPSIPTSSSAVTVTADIVDLDGTITGASLYYAVGAANQSYTQVALNNTTGNTYTGTIPAAAEGSFVKYYVTASDDSSNTTILPNPNIADGTYFYTVRDNGLSIYDIQFTPFSNGNSGYRDQEVTVTGVVIGSSRTADADLGFTFIQEEGKSSWAGIMCLGDPALANYSRGDKITVTGTVKESFGYTRLENITNVVSAGTGNIQPLPLVPDSFASYSFASNERYEGMLIALADQNGNRLHVVEKNADAPNNYAEYRVGRDPFDPTNGCRVIAGNPGGNTPNSANVSYINDSMWVANLNVPAVVLDTMTMDTLVGIMYYSFGAMKMMPRNNADFIGASVLPESNNTSVQSEATFANNVKVYPNPATGFLNVETGLTNQVSTITIFNLQGKEVFKRITMLENNTINVSELNAGLYIIQVESNNELISVGKIAINK